MHEETTHTLMQKLDLTDARIASRLEQLDLTPADRELLRAAWPGVERQLSHFASNLYKRFQGFPRLNAVLAHESRIARLIDLQKQYLRQLFLSPLDVSYVSGRITIGLVHHRIRVTPQWYMATYSHFLCDHVDVLIDQAGSIDDGVESVIVLMKNLFFDAALVLDAYGLSEFTSARNKRHNSAARYAVNDPQQRQSNSADPSRHITRIQLSDEETQQRAAFIELTDRDVANMHSLKTTLESIVPTILVDFYDYLQRSPEFRQLVSPAQVDRLMQQVNSYWQEFSTGSFDRTYAASRMRVGVIHESLGIGPQSYLAGLSRQAVRFLRHFPKITDHPKELIKSFFRGLIFDITFIIDAYMESRVESLLRTEGYASQLMTGLNALVVIVDKDRQILYANDRFVELVGIEPSLLYMMRLEDAFPFDQVIAALNKVTTQTSPRITFVSRWNYATYRVSVMELQESEEHSADVFAVVLDDVGDLVRITHTIEEDEANYERLSNAVPAVLWEIDLETQSIVMISRQSFEVTGFRAVYFLGRSNAWRDQLLSEHRGDFVEALRRSQVGQVTAYEYRMLRADGTHVWLRSHFSRLADAEQRVVAITVDVSDVRQAEHRKLSALKLLAGGVSHNLNNALTAVLSNIELHKLESADSAMPIYLDRALQAGQRAANLLSYLQAYAGRQQLRPSEVDLNVLIQKAMLNLQSSLGPLNAQFHLADDLWPIHVDERAIVSSLEQICFNAIQASDGGNAIESKLSIRTRNLSQEQLDPMDVGFGSSWVELQVEDFGVGMEPHVLSQAIDPFFTTRSQQQSDGVGLSMVYGFVTQSGGHLQIDSHHGQGTRVRILLPKSSNSSPVADQPSPRQSKILIVDDDPEVAIATAQLVRHFGYDARYATSSHAAMQSLADQHADLILVDLLLHDGVDGHNLALMAMKKYPNLVVVAMSGNSQLLGHPKISETKIPFLAKPFSVKQLSATIAGALAEKSKR